MEKSTKQFIAVVAISIIIGLGLRTVTDHLNITPNNAFANSTSIVSK